MDASCLLQSQPTVALDTCLGSAWRMVWPHCLPTPCTSGRRLIQLAETRYCLSLRLLQPEFRKRLPPFVGWAYPAFEQIALAPLVFLPATFPIIVLPGDKLFQSRDVSPDFQLAPITHAYGGSKTRVGKALRMKGDAAMMPLLVTLLGGDGKLPMGASGRM